MHNRFEMIIGLNEEPILFDVLNARVERDDEDTDALRQGKEEILLVYCSSISSVKVNPRH